MAFNHGTLSENGKPTIILQEKQVILSL